MELAAWKCADLDERYWLLEHPGQAVALCRLLGGHRSSEEDELEVSLRAWWAHGESIGGRGMLQALRSAAESLPSVKSMLIAGVCLQQMNRVLDVSGFGSYLSLFRNGRKVAGGREPSIDWRSALYDDVPLCLSSRSSGGDRVYNYTIEPCEDEFLVGSPFLESYASEAEIAELRSENSPLTQKLERFGTLLVNRADLDAMRSDRYTVPAHRQDRILLLLKTGNVKQNDSNTVLGA